MIRVNGETIETIIYSKLKFLQAQVGGQREDRVRVGGGGHHRPEHHRAVHRVSTGYFHYMVAQNTLRKFARFSAIFFCFHVSVIVNLFAPFGSLSLKYLNFHFLH